MPTLELKPNHKLVPPYYAALAQFDLHRVTRETAVALFAPPSEEATTKHTKYTKGSGRNNPRRGNKPFAIFQAMMGLSFRVVRVFRGFSILVFRFATCH